MSSSICPGGGGGGGANYIEHHVSKMDTLAGVAIKYGVEVADIKKMNALVTDLQMFALKSLRIPLLGRHPPSLRPANDFSTTGTRNLEWNSLRHSHSVASFQSLGLKSTQKSVSPAMSSLQGFYGLKTSSRKSATEGTELAVYATNRSHYMDDGILRKPSPVYDSPSSGHRRSRSLVNDFLRENGELIEGVPVSEARDSEVENSVRRRQKADADIGFHSPEMLLKEENSGSSAFLAKTGKGLALRPKSASRTNLAADTDSGWLKPLPVGVGNSLLANVFIGVRKSCSTSNLQEQDNSDSSSILPSLKWTLKSDLQALSATAIARPIFDSLPKPITNRKNKAALD